MLDKQKKQPPFQVGDTIECVSEYGSNGYCMSLTKGAHYIVQGVSYSILCREWQVALRPRPSGNIQNYPVGYFKTHSSKN